MPSQKGDCTSSHVVYAAECTKHQLLRFNNHRSEINLGAHTCELVQHFSTLDCNFDKDLKIHILQHNKKQIIRMPAGLRKISGQLSWTPNHPIA